MCSGCDGLLAVVKSDGTVQLKDGTPPSTVKEHMHYYAAKLGPSPDRVPVPRSKRKKTTYTPSEEQ